MPSPGSVAAAARRGSPDRPTHEQQRQWQDSLRRRRPPDRPPPSPPAIRARHAQLDTADKSLRCVRLDSDDDAGRAELRQGTERARAAAIAKAEIECIRRAELRAAQAALASTSPQCLDVDENSSSETGGTPWITPRYNRGLDSSSVPDPDWDELWDSGVSAAAAAASSAPESAETSSEHSRRAYTRATAALLRAQNGDARAPVPYIDSEMTSRKQRGAEQRNASLAALEKRVAEAEKKLERRERSARRSSADMSAGALRRTRSAGEYARTSMAEIKRVAHSRVVSIELTEDGLEQEHLWLERRRQVQQQQARLNSTGQVAGEPSGSPGGWLGSASLAARVESENCSSLPTQSQSGGACHSPLERSSRGAAGESFAAQTKVADERKRHQQYVLEQKETVLQHEACGNSSDGDDDDIGSGDGLHVEPEPTKSPKPSDSLLPDLVCPNGHELTAYETPIDGYKCDECGTIVSARHLMQSCRPCEHDICEECVRSRIQRELHQVGESGVQRSMLDDVAMTTERTTDGRGLQEFPFDLSSVLFEKSAHDRTATDPRSGGRRRKQQARSSRVIEWSVALLILAYFTAVYMWRGTVDTPTGISMGQVHD